MPFWKSKKTKNRKKGGGGFLTYDDAYQLIQDNIDEAVEFYELEPAVVIFPLTLIKSFTAIGMP